MHKKPLLARQPPLEKTARLISCDLQESWEHRRLQEASAAEAAAEEEAMKLEAEARCEKLPREMFTCRSVLVPTLGCSDCLNLYSDYFEILDVS